LSSGHSSLRIGDSVLVVVGIRAAVLVLEPVLVLGLVGAAVVLVGDAVVIGVLEALVARRIVAV